MKNHSFSLKIFFSVQPKTIIVILEVLEWLNQMQIFIFGWTVPLNLVSLSKLSLTLYFYRFEKKDNPRLGVLVTLSRIRCYKEKGKKKKRKYFKTYAKDRKRLWVSFGLLQCEWEKEPQLPQQVVFMRRDESNDLFTSKQYLLTSIKKSLRPSEIQAKVLDHLMWLLQ